jgi:pilus assembly protein CpaE
VSTDLLPNLGSKYYADTIGAETMSVALIGPDEGRRWALAKALAETGRAKVREFHSYPTGRGDFQWLLEQSFDAIILDLDSDPDVALELVERVNASDAATIMVYSEKADTKLAGSFMRAGAREYLLLPLEEGIVEEALVRTAGILRPKAPSAETALGKLLVFLGAKGGTGVTTIACNLAIALARESDQSTLLIDLSAPIGDVALTLGIVADYTTEDALGNADRLDTSFLQGLLVKHRSGVFVLAAPSEIPEVEAPIDAIDKLITVARRKFDHVIVDIGSRIDAASMALFKKSSTIYLVTQTGISELRNSNRFISQFFTEGGPTLEIVINRFEPRLLGGVQEDVVTKALGRPVRWKIPDDQDAAREKQCGETGLAPTRVSRLSLEMASSITGRPVPQEKKRGFGLKGLGRSSAKEVSGNDDSSGISIATPAYLRATSTITWPTPDMIIYGDALTTDQLCATASVPGTFDYSPMPGEVLSAGTHTLCVTFTPRDSANYAAAQATVQLKVAGATPAVAWRDPEPIPYGTPLGAAQLCATASVPGTFDYSPMPGEVLAAGTHTLCVTFTPRDSANYGAVLAAVPLRVVEAPQAFSWRDPEMIQQGTPRGARQLSAMAWVRRTFGHPPAAGRILAPEGLSDIASLPTGSQWMPSNQSITANGSALADSVPAEVTRKRSATRTNPRETRMYKGSVYEKGEDGQWHLQQK